MFGEFAICGMGGGEIKRKDCPLGQKYKNNLNILSGCIVKTRLNILNTAFGYSVAWLVYSPGNVASALTRENNRYDSQYVTGHFADLRLPSG